MRRKIMASDIPIRLLSQGAARAIAVPDRAEKTAFVMSAFFKRDDFCGALWVMIFLLVT